MSYSEFLKSKINVITLYFGIIFIASFVNFFDIRGKTGYYNIHGEQECILTKGCKGDEFWESSDGFWPFNDYFSEGGEFYKPNSIGIYSYGSPTEYHRSSFRGIFYNFNFPELIFYSVIFFVGTFLYWHNKKQK